jgi:hypothetical protein
MKYAAIVTLLAGLCLGSVPNGRTYGAFIVAAAATLVLVQALDLRHYWWAASFGAIALVFNPVRLVEFSFKPTVALQVLTAVVFAVSLQLLRTSPRLTIASITDADPRTESL